jgi:hypothetical protein
MQIQYLSITSQHWVADGNLINEHIHFTTIWPIIDYLSLRELILVIDKEYERRLVLNIASVSGVPPVWTLPGMSILETSI